MAVSLLLQPGATTDTRYRPVAHRTHAARVQGAPCGAHPGRMGVHELQVSSASPPLPFPRLTDRPSRTVP